LKKRYLAWVEGRVHRREFITAVVGSAVAWPLASVAQQTAMPVIGFLGTASPGPFAHLIASFRKGRQETGFAEGYNVAIEYRWAESEYARVPGVGIPSVRPRARTLPVSQSSSRRLPCSRSYAIEALWDHALARAVLGVHVRVLLGF
jgi:hypothetical protein